MLFVLGWLLATLALALLAYDGLFLLSWGFDVTDIAGISEGYVIDWPTGERPPWAMVPAYAYAFALLSLAWGTFLVRRRIGLSYSCRIWRGSE